MTDTTVILSSRTENFRTNAGKVTWLTGRLTAAARLLVAGLEAYSGALSQAYVAPFQLPARKREPGLDGDLEGRDPTW